VPADSVPVDAISAALCQFDVRLEGIDVVSVRTRHLADVAGPSPTTDDPIDGDQRNTWVILRMDPQRNVGAMAARDSVASTLAAATERLADALGGRRYAPRPLTADEIAEVDAAVLAGLQPTWSRPGWRHLKHINGYATSFWVSPKDITSDMLDQLWLPNTDATVLTVRITTRGGRPEVSAWVRYHSSGQLPKDMCAGLNRLTGRQLAAVRASLPAPTRRSRLVVPAGALGDSEPLAVRVEPAPGSPPQESIVLAE
jgi:type VII secretion protein EccE